MRRAPASRASHQVVRLAIVMSLCLTLAFPANAEPARPLKTAVDATMAPHVFRGPDGTLKGLNVDLMHEVARRLGRPLEITEAPFGELTGLLESRAVDFIGAPLTVTRARAGRIAFSEAYLEADLAILAPAGTNPIRELKDLKGKRIAVARGSVYEQWAYARIAAAGWRIESFGTQVEASRRIIDKQADATVMARTNALWTAKQVPALAVVHVHKTGLRWAMAVSRDQKELRRDLESVIECIKHDGTLARLIEHWLGERPAPGSLAITIVPGVGVPDMPGFDATAGAPPCSQPIPR